MHCCAEGLALQCLSLFYARQQSTPLVMLTDSFTIFFSFFLIKFVARGRQVRTTKIAKVASIVYALKNKGAVKYRATEGKLTMTNRLVSTSCTKLEFLRNAWKRVESWQIQWRTFPKSPSTNPIEYLWHKLKVCLLCAAYLINQIVECSSDATWYW